MEIRQLRFFLEIIRQENITKAADILHITQPALSRAIMQLEDEIGETLFERGRHLELTEAGFRLKSRAEEVCSLFDKMESEFKSGETVAGVVSIGIGGYNTSEKLPEIISKFKKQYPNVSFEFLTDNADSVKEKIERGILDFGFMIEPVDVEKFDFLEMKEKARWGLLVNKKNPIAKKEFVTKNDLKSETLIMSSRIAVQKEIERRLKISFSELDILATYNILSNATTFAQKNIASLFTIESVVSNVDKKSLVFIPLKPELSMTIVFAWKKQHSASTAAGKFLDFFKNAI